MSKTSTAVVPLKQKKEQVKPLRRKLYLRTPMGQVSQHFVEVKHIGNPAVELMKRIGDVPTGVVQFGRVLVAVYQPPMVTTTAGGIHLTDQVSQKDLDEFLYQGKVGLVVAKGSMAYVDDDHVKFHGVNNELGDWIWFRPSDGIACEVNEVFCRILNERDIIGRIPHPDYIW